MRRKLKLLIAMNDKELAGALLVRLVNNDMLTGVITELCTRLQRDAPRLFAYKIKYLCNLLREKARAYDRNVWIKFAVEHQEEYIYNYLDDLTEYLSTYAEAWKMPWNPTTKLRAYLLRTFCHGCKSQAQCAGQILN